ncbi:MAG TPA: isoprenylcysteine carboxylmethyltransferase family protein [Vicinamibacterales bacterium]|nr:isoprenylcysteine carboxylmethyltransferase family protein [Vicinamibacterales bacterium]
MSDRRGAAALTRLRVPLGFACAGIAFWLAHPRPLSVAAGMSVAAIGELVRLWAAGHIEKGREITRSGPYRLVRHPLYAGSAIMGIGFMIAARSLPAAIVVGVYLVVALVSAARAEEATLDARFAGEYSAYREGRAAPSDRPFSLARVKANREYRAVIGLVVGCVLLFLRSL